MAVFWSSLKTRSNSLRAVAISLGGNDRSPRPVRNSRDSLCAKSSLWRGHYRLQSYTNKVFWRCRFEEARVPTVPVIRADSPYFISFALILAECDAGNASPATVLRKRSDLRQFQPVHAVGVS